MALKTYGTMAVDWEQRIDFDRLRRERLARVKALLAKSEMGALLCFDMNNVRYITATHIGTWAQDKISRFTLLPQNDEPILWDFGSAARHHQLNCPWLGERSRPGIPLLRGAMSPEMGRAEDVARKIKIELEKRGLHKEPLGIDVVEPPILFALQTRRHHGRRRPAADVRRPRHQDAGRDRAAQHVRHDGGRGLRRAVSRHEAGHERERGRRPGEQGAVRPRLGIRRRRQRHFRRALQSASARLFRSRAAARRSGVLRHSAFLHGLPHLLLPLLHDRLRHRTRWSTPTSAAAIIWMPPSTLVRPGRTTAEIASVWPKAQEFGFPNEEAAFALQFGHGIGLGDLGKAGDQPAGFARAFARDQAGHGVRARNLLAVEGRLERRAHRGRNRRHRDRPRSDHALPRREAAGGRARITSPSTARCPRLARPKRLPAGAWSK